jgi:sulfur carrier protein ThiS
MPKSQRSVQVRISIGGEARTLSIPAGSSAGDLLKSLGLLREEYILLKSGHVVYEFETLGEGDSIELIRAFSGG